MLGPCMLLYDLRMELCVSQMTWRNPFPKPSEHVTHEIHDKNGAHEYLSGHAKWIQNEKCKMKDGQWKMDMQNEKWKMDMQNGYKMDLGSLFSSKTFRVQMPSTNEVDNLHAKTILVPIENWRFGLSIGGRIIFVWKLSTIFLRHMYFTQIHFSFGFLYFLVGPTFLRRLLDVWNFICDTPIYYTYAMCVC